MTIEAIEVVDTTIKVGLGAVISGITTYVITKTTSSAERRKFMLEKKLEILEDCVAKVEPYKYSVQLYLSKIDAALNKGLTSIDSEHFYEDNKISEVDAEFLVTVRDASLACSKLKMIGFGDVYSTVKKFVDFGNSLRTKIIFDKTMPSKSDHLELRTQLIEIIQDYHNSLDQSFLSLRVGSGGKRFIIFCMATLVVLAIASAYQFFSNNQSLYLFSFFLMLFGLILCSIVYSQSE